MPSKMLEQEDLQAPPSTLELSTSEPNASQEILK
jgi:hypothetical protein